ncbi:MAG: nicotinate (nicotinamide) nucleotide adenylyltransferase [Bacteroidota bacterium]|nr:nicotinate (nicotinamide) nucleotide adenylyltransferase [Bacteroidota bacterium]
MKTGLYFGSFNPIHIGHLAIANYMLEFTDLLELWFVVSPHNPLKKKSTLLDERQRLEMVRLALGNDQRFRVSDIEFKLPQPSYTIDTLTYLEEKFPEREFALIMGSDNLRTIHKWKNIENILTNYQILVYPRPDYSEDEQNIKVPNKITITQAPLMEISSVFIRKSIKEGKDVQYFLPEKVYQYIREMHFYEK